MKVTSDQPRSGDRPDLRAFIEGNSWTVTFGPGPGWPDFLHIWC